MNKSDLNIGVSRLGLSTSRGDGRSKALSMVMIYDIPGAFNNAILVRISNMLVMVSFP